MKVKAETSRIPWIFIALSAATWTYIWLRAFHLQFSIDETATFFMYIQPGRFIPPNAVVDANNHILNSFLSWGCFEIFGPLPWAMRLPNVMAALWYFYFIYQLGSYINKSGPRWIFFLLSLGTHFIIEFFGYARGYGLSMAFLAGSVYFTFGLNKKFNLLTLIKAYLFIMLGLLANFNLIFTALALMGVITFVIWKRRISISRRSVAIILAVNLLVVLPLVAYVTFVSFQIRDHSGFYYGSSDGFLTVTAKSLSNMLAGDLGRFMLVYFLVLIAGMAISLMPRLSRFKPGKYDLFPAIALLLLLLANWAGALLLNSIWNINFQEDRAAMQYVPLIFLLVLLGLDRLSCNRLPMLWLAALPLLVLPVYSASRISLESGVYGPRQMAPEKYFEYISENHKDQDFPPIVSAWQTRKQPWAFLNYSHEGRLNPIQSDGYPLSNADFIILENELAAAIPRGFRAVMSDNASSTILYERSAPGGWKQMDSLAILSHYNTPDPFENLYEMDLEGDSIHQLLVRLECCIHSKFKPFEAVVVLEALDAEKRPVRYEAIDLDQLRPRWRQKAGNFKYSLTISDIPPEADSVLLYFWNKKQALCTIEEARVEIFYQ